MLKILLVYNSWYDHRAVQLQILNLPQVLVRQTVGQDDCRTVRTDIIARLRFDTAHNDVGGAQSANLLQCFLLEPSPIETIAMTEATPRMFLAVSGSCAACATASCGLRDGKLPGTYRSVLTGGRITQQRCDQVLCVDRNEFAFLESALNGHARVASLPQFDRPRDYLIILVFDHHVSLVLVLYHCMQRNINNVGQRIDQISETAVIPGLRPSTLSLIVINVW